MTLSYGAAEPSAADLTAATAKAALWAHAAALPNIRGVVPVTLDLSTSNYLQWRVTFYDAVEKYALEDHLLADTYSTNPLP